jgi:hypothetical protein
MRPIRFIFGTTHSFFTLPGGETETFHHFLQLTNVLPLISWTIQKIDGGGDWDEDF